jgi:hypothetical protein
LAGFSTSIGRADEREAFRKGRIMGAQTLGVLMTGLALALVSFSPG